LSGEARGGADAILSAAGSGAVFLSLWLGLGVPLPWSAAAAALGYGALWMISRSRKGPKEGLSFIEPPIDRELARKSAEKGHRLAGELRAAADRIDGSLARALGTLAERMDDIASDVEADPKDAPSASAFLEIQGEASARISRLASGLIGDPRGRGELDGTRDKIEGAISRLIASSERQLNNMRSDNVAELMAELDLIEGGLSLDEDESRESGAR